MIDFSYDELQRLVSCLCDGGLALQEMNRLEEILNGAPEARKFYLTFIELHGELAWTYGELAAEVLARNQPSVPLTTIVRSSSKSFRARVPHWIGWAASLLLGGYFVVLAVMLIWDRMHAGTHDRVAEQRFSEQPAVLTHADNAKWSQPSIVSGNSSDQHTLQVRSGNAELQFAGGATVVVKGPAEFEVQSPSRGFLKVGHLRALVPPRAVGFVIETPSAEIVDLGTEFDVEVTQTGATDVRVLRGLVEVAESSTQRAGKAKQPLRLSAGESLRVDRDTANNFVATKPANPVSPNSKVGIEFLDLVDIVAGGNGRGGQRDRGIDAATGRIVYRPDDDFLLFSYRQSYGYCRPDDRPFIDGLGIPDSAKGPVQLDSAGHTFANFPKTDGTAYGPVWAGGSVPERTPVKLRTTFDGKLDYAAAPHGLVALYPNKLITFDLEALRREHRGRKLLSFRATVGVTSPDPVTYPGLADTWIFVDGKLRHSRPTIDASHGPQDVEIVLPQTARFLTLAATDGGNTPTFDWVIFADPQIKLQASDTRPSDNPSSTIK